MNKFTLPFRALLLGFVIEASGIALFSTSDFGPCAPSNPLGFVGTLVHLPMLSALGGLSPLLPKTWLNSPVNSPSPVWIFGAIFQWMFYSAIAYLYLVRRPVRPGGQSS